MALAALTLHTACLLLVEVLHGALQAHLRRPDDDRALGMRPAVAYWTVIWPQARRIIALGVFVGAVKDTSLVSIVGVFDVLGAAKAIVAGTN